MHSRSVSSDEFSNSLKLKFPSNVEPKTQFYARLWLIFFSPLFAVHSSCRRFSVCLLVNKNFAALALTVTSPQSISRSLLPYLSLSPFFAPFPKSCEARFRSKLMDFVTFAVCCTHHRRRRHTHMAVMDIVHFIHAHQWDGKFMSFPWSGWYDFNVTLMD